MAKRVNKAIIFLILSISKLISTAEGFSVLMNESHSNRSSNEDKLFDTCKKWHSTAAILGITFNFLCPCYNAVGTEIDSIALQSGVVTPNPSSSVKEQVWHLPNGDVALSQTLSNFKAFSLKNPVLLGSGGGGAVFSTDAHDGSNKKVAIKVSWVRSADSVKRECEIMRKLEENNTRNVERCLGLEPYAEDTRRIVVALEPVVNNPTAIIIGETPEVQKKVVQAIIRTMVDMLVANVVTSDVQILIEKDTGSTLFIDMTEANEMSFPPSFLDLALAAGFINEIVSLIPDSMGSVASQTLLDEFIQADAKGAYISKEVYDIIGTQNILMSPEVTNYIASKIQQRGAEQP
jgi:hypothetical protein